MMKTYYKADYDGVDKNFFDGDESRRKIYRRLVELLDTEEYDPVPDDRVVKVSEILERIVTVLENINMNIKSKRPHDENCGLCND